MSPNEKIDQLAKEMSLKKTVLTLEQQKMLGKEGMFELGKKSVLFYYSPTTKILVLYSLSGQDQEMLDKLLQKT